MAMAPIGYDGTVPRQNDEERLVAGAAVYGADGEKVGAVADIGREFFLVQDGLLTIRNMYLPQSSVAYIDADGVHLTLAKRDAEAMARQELPAEGDPWYGPRSAAPVIVRVMELPLREQAVVTRTVATVKREVLIRKSIAWKTERVATAIRRENVRVDEASATRVHIEHPGSVRG